MTRREGNHLHGNFSDKDETETRTDGGQQRAIDVWAYYNV